MKKDFIITRMTRFTKNLKKYLKFLKNEFYCYHDNRYIITNDFSMICIEKKPINKYKINILKSTIDNSRAKYLTLERLEIVYDEFANYNWQEIDYYKIKETTPLGEIANVKIKTLKIKKYFSIDLSILKECLDLSDTRKENIKYYTSDNMPVLKIQAEDIEIYMLGRKPSRLKTKKDNEK